MSTEGLVQRDVSPCIRSVPRFLCDRSPVLSSTWSWNWHLGRLWDRWFWWNPIYYMQFGRDPSVLDVNCGCYNIFCNDLKVRVFLILQPRLPDHKNLKSTLTPRVRYRILHLYESEISAWQLSTNAAANLWKWKYGRRGNRVCKNAKNSFYGWWLLMPLRAGVWKSGIERVHSPDSIPDFLTPALDSLRSHQPKRIFL